MNLNKGENLVEDKAICFVEDEINVEDGKQVKANFTCKIENIIENYTDLEIVSSEDIIDIPTDPVLINPVKIGKLIS